MIECELTKERFEFEKEEREAYADFGLPLPMISPNERLRRFLSFVGAQRLFLRSAGDGVSLVSVFPQSVPFSVTAADDYYSPKGLDEVARMSFSLREDFFQQLLRLWQKAPRPAIPRWPGQGGLRHLLVDPYRKLFECEDSFSSFNCVRAARCEHSSDLYQCRDCIGCYECVWCEQSTNLRWSSHATNCHESAFLLNCSDCRNCLFCCNLRGKSFHLFNQPVNEERYWEAVREAGLDDAERVEEARTKFRDFTLTAPLPHLYTDSDSVTGNYVYASVGCLRVFEVRSCAAAINVALAEGVQRGIDLYDCCGNIADCAQSVGLRGNATRVINSCYCSGEISDLAYCGWCEDSHHLLGCVGLRKRSYCIFNAQYSKEDYVALRAEIEETLRSRLVWGEPLPPIFSDFSYNLSRAGQYFALSEGQAAQLGFAWNGGAERLAPLKLLERIYEGGTKELREVPPKTELIAPEDARRVVYLCEISAEPYQLSPEEIDLYRVLKVPPPRRAFYERHAERLSTLTPPRMIWSSDFGTWNADWGGRPGRTVIRRDEWLNFVMGQ